MQQKEGIRMIDETLSIEKIKERIEIHKKDYQAFKNYSGDRKIKDIAKWDECIVIIDLIKNQPKVGEWIPCSERLPKETDFPEQKYRILASCSDGIVRNATIENLRDRSKKHFNGSQCEFAYLAWQPLPEPYKE